MHVQPDPGTETLLPVREMGHPQAGVHERGSEHLVPPTSRQVLMLNTQRLGSVVSWLTYISGAIILFVLGIRIIYFQAKTIKSISVRSWGIKRTYVNRYLIQLGCGSGKLFTSTIEQDFIFFLLKFVVLGHDLWSALDIQVRITSRKYWLRQNPEQLDPSAFYNTEIFSASEK